MNIMSGFSMRNICGIKRLSAILLAIGVSTATQSQTLLADVPVLASVVTPGNVALTLSVEWPTALSMATPASFDYSGSVEYPGYFDPTRCYDYNVGDATTEGPSGEQAYFNPSVPADSSHNCSGKWSGNFLNWAGMQTIDPFRWALTGGYRSVDTSSLTILEKGWMPGVQVSPSLTQGTPVLLDVTSGASGLNPFGWSSIKTMMVRGGVSMAFTSTGTLPSSTTTAYTGSATATASTVYTAAIRVKVCTTSGGNCKKYPNGKYKPEGLLQQYATKMRFSVFGYLMNPDVTLDGGVLRAKMKYVGPTDPNLGGIPTVNAASEWDANTGVLNPNPDPSDATGTNSLYSCSGCVVSSGVINYINQFGQYSTTANSKGKYFGGDANSTWGGPFKSKDPVSELYYAAVRYFKNQGNIPEYYSLGVTGPTLKEYIDGFPVVKDWVDPIKYSCQKNFIIGIGDINTHRDENVPGATLTATDSSEPTPPAKVSADNTVNVTTALNKIAAMEGLSGLSTARPLTGGSSHPNPPVASLNFATYYIAGLAYDSHTKDMRPNDFKNADGTKTYTQTISTYWVDVVENGVFIPKNQYWLAAKYGGFVVPSGFDPYAASPSFPQSAWNQNGEVAYATNGSDVIQESGGTGITQYDLPDNYFTGNNSVNMVAGLKNAFLGVAANINAVGTQFSTAGPKISYGGATSFSATYDTGKWVGELTASNMVFDTQGLATLTKIWGAQSKLDAQVAVSGNTGWDTNRIIVTCCSSTSGKAIPFRNASLTTATTTALTSTGATATQMINYLRGDKSNVVPNGANRFRARTHVLGDIVNARPLVVGPPSQGFTETTNKGYKAFIRQYANRKPVVFVGANDGMLHAFDASVDVSVIGNTAGKELFAYVPSVLYQGPTAPDVDGLASLGDPSTPYEHHFFVDATPFSIDVDFNNAATRTSTTPDWHTLLIGGLGKGGKAYYAIDITDPTSWTTETAVAGKVLWEFTGPPAGSPGTLGLTYASPKVVKTAKYGWVVIVSSGYNNSDGKGYLFFLDPKDGHWLETVSTGVGTITNPSGLSEAMALIPDSTTFVASTLYAGDLLGNMWRVDLTTSGSYSAFNFAQVTSPSTSSGGALPQPITTWPLISITSTGNTGGIKERYIVFGTGKLLDATDMITAQVQSIYAIKDGTLDKTFSNASPLPSNALALPTGASFPVTRSILTRNTNLLTPVTSATAPMGWYYDLPTDAATGIAERVDQPPQVNGGFVSLVGDSPVATDPCVPTGTADILAIDVGRGLSVLRDSSGQIITSSVSPGLSTDIAFFNEDGRPGLQVGTTKGIFNPKSDLSGGTSTKLLNWRVINTGN